MKEKRVQEEAWVESSDTLQRDYNLISSIHEGEDGITQEDHFLVLNLQMTKFKELVFLYK